MSKTQANRLIGAADVTRDLTPIGVIPSSESVARPLASLPTEQRQEVWKKVVESTDGKPTAANVTKAVEGIKQVASNGVTTTSEVKHQLAQQIRQSPPPLPTTRFDVIVIDPPWKYDTRGDDHTHRGRVTYPDMSLEEIIALPVPVLAEDNSILWLWTTNSFTGEAFKCLETWGFTPKTILTWVKTTKDGSEPRMGLGNWLRNVTEHCLLAAKGHPASPSRSGLLKTQTTVIHAPRREHSRKPDEFYSIVESLCPGSKLEMFARSERPGWTGWGAELNLFDVKTDAELLEPTYSQQCNYLF